MEHFDLNKVRVNHPFKVPDGYFEELESKVFENSSHSLRGINDQDVKSPFSVPDSYFDKLNKSILDEIDDQKTRKIEVHTRNKLWYSIAAAIVMVLISIPLFFQNNSVTPDSNVLADISNEEILLYLDYYEVDEMDLIETIDENMEWVNDEDQLLEEMDLEDTNIDELYLEYGLSEII